MKSPVLARLTVTRQDESKVIVEVRADATFHQFYAFHTQQGRKRSTKTFTRWGSRNEGLQPVNAHLQVPGLEILALRFLHNRFGKSPVVSTRIRFFSKKAYRKLIRMTPDELGLTKVKALFDERPIRVQLPRVPSFKRVQKMNHLKIHAGATR